MTKFRSKLGPFEDEIRSLKTFGLSTREIHGWGAIDAAVFAATHSVFKKKQ